VVSSLFRCSAPQAREQWNSPLTWPRQAAKEFSSSLELIGCLGA